MSETPEVKQEENHNPTIFFIICLLFTGAILVLLGRSIIKLTIKRKDDDYRILHFSIFNCILSGMMLLFFVQHPYNYSVNGGIVHFTTPVPVDAKLELSLRYINSSTPSDETWKIYPMGFGYDNGYCDGHTTLERIDSTTYKFNDIFDGGILGRNYTLGDTTHRDTTTYYTNKYGYIEGGSLYTWIAAYVAAIIGLMASLIKKSDEYITL